jgi:hypothetical protein
MSKWTAVPYKPAFTEAMLVGPGPASVKYVPGLRALGDESAAVTVPVGTGMGRVSFKA